jgi:hypothetical protein
MIKALAPRKSRGCSWVWLSIVLAGGFPVTVSAQGSAKPAGADAAAAAPATDDEAAPEDGTKKLAKPLEVFKDPNAEAALDPNKIKEYGRPLSGNSVISQVKSMAAGGVGIDRDTISKFVDGMVSILTSKNNINALVSPAPGKSNPNQAHAIQTATDDLTEMISRARAANNLDFLKVYNAALLKALPPLLSGHLMTRLEAMIVLAQTGNPDAVKVFTDQLTDPKQTVWVKLWAARGLTNIAQSPTGNTVDSTLGQAGAIKAGKTLAAMLENGRDLPWPVQYRALEALGAMRLAADPTAQSKAEMAQAAARYLTDPDARPDIRAEAAWALGMMRVSNAISKYNFPLIAFHTGEIAADLGDKIAATYQDNPILAAHWTGLLLYQLYPALWGYSSIGSQPPFAREAGLLSVTNLGPSRGFIQQVGDSIKAVSKASADLVNGTRGQVPANLKALSEQVAALRAVLDKNPPADKRLVPGGPVLPIRNPAVAGNANPPR